MSTSGSSNENYMLIACGSTHHAPFLAGWQEFKDSLRKIVEYQPGWTVVEPKAGWRRGEMQGWSRIERKDDAEVAYAHYAGMGGVLVHLYKTSRSSVDYRLLKCNCCSHFPGMSEREHSPHRSGIDAGGVNQYISRAGTVASPQYTVPAAPVYSYHGYPPASAYTALPSYSLQVAPMQYAGPQMPIYSTSTGGIPVNVRSGAMITEARGIFINNLNYSCDPTELNRLLSTVGRPVESRLHRDSRTGQFKGSATAKFASKQEADYAVAGLNGRQHMNMTINVRLDTDTTVVGQVQPPVIVNGSNASRYTGGSGYYG